MPKPYANQRTIYGIINNFIIYCWVNNINKILKGLYSNLEVNTTDKIKALAYTWRSKHK